jgi:hypothetical protein
MTIKPNGAGVTKPIELEAMIDQALRRESAPKMKVEGSTFDKGG